MAAQRLLVTGATGFLGSHVLRHMRARGAYEIWATSHLPDIAPGLCDVYRQTDLCDPAAVTSLVNDSRPARVIHLAGLIGKAGLERFLAVNVVGTENLYNALLSKSGDRHAANSAARQSPVLPATHPTTALRIVQVGSAAQYGTIQPGDLPILESQPFRPLTPYAISKAAQDMLATAMWRTLGLPVVVGRIFNLLGPGQPVDLVPMTFAVQLARIRQGAPAVLQTGNLQSTRDFVDARDVAAALEALLETGRPGEAYNIASGADVSIQSVLDMLLEISGVTATVQSAADRARPSDVPRVRADIAKITAETSWQPKITLRQSLADMWDAARDGGL